MCCGVAAMSYVLVPFKEAPASPSFKKISTSKSVPGWMRFCDSQISGTSSHGSSITGNPVSEVKR
jgi:hypothetical protein